VVRLWRKEEDAVILESYQKLGAKRLARIINRSPQAIHGRALQIGITDRSSWSKAEDLIVRLCYGVVGVSAIIKNLPNRTVGAIYARAWRLGLAEKRRDW